jgi:hypothetical protein
MDSQTDIESSVASVADSHQLRQLLGIDCSRAGLASELKQALKTIPRGSLFDDGGLCSGYTLRPMADHYFTAQEFSANRNDLRAALTEALAEFDVTPTCADDTLWSGHILCKIGALIQCTPFGVYQLSVSQNRNVYLELGMAIGLGRPFILIKDRAADVSPLFEGFEYYSINSYIELRHELGDKVQPYLAGIINYARPKLPVAGCAQTAVIAHGELDSIDFCVPIARTIARHNLTPVILGDPTGKISLYLEREKVVHQIVGNAGRIQLDETLSAIQAARFGVYRVEKVSAPDTFLALGISMGLSRPGFLTHLANQDTPADVRGLSALGFTSYSDLDRSFSAAYEHLLTSYS